MLQDRALRSVTAALEALTPALEAGPMEPAKNKAINMIGTARATVTTRRFKVDHP
jgi:hypothetical protein